MKLRDVIVRCEGSGFMVQHILFRLDNNIHRKCVTVDSEVIHSREVLYDNNINNIYIDLDGGLIFNYDMNNNDINIINEIDYDYILRKFIDMVVK